MRRDSPSVSVGALSVEPERLLTPAIVRLLAVQTAFGFSFSVFFLLPKFLTEVGADPSEIGIVMSLWGVAGVLVSPPVGAGVDRVGRRPFLIAGSALMAVSAFGYTAVQAYGILAVLLRSLQGVAFAFTFNAVMTMAADVAPRGRLGQAVGLTGLAGLVTNAAAPAAAESLAEGAGWHWAFALSGAVAVLALGLALGVREPPPSVTPEGHEADWGTVLRRAEPRAHFGVSIAAGVGFGTMITFHQPFAIELGIGWVRGFFIAYTVAAVAFRLGLMPLVDRLGARPVAVVSLGMYAVVVAATGALDSLGLEVLGAGLGAAHGVFFPAISTLAVERAPAAERGRRMSLIYTGFNGGLAASMLALGPVAEAFGYPALFAAAGAVVALGAVRLLLPGAAESPTADRP